MRRWRDQVSLAILLGTLIILTLGALQAFAVDLGSIPSQDAINAAMDERVKAVIDRVASLESLVRYALLGIVGNLLSHLFQVTRRGRSE